MKNVLKRNQIIILVIALMLVSAGYLSYSGNQLDTLTTSSEQVEDETKYAGIGDAKLVNSNSVAEEKEVALVSNEEENKPSNEEIIEESKTGAVVENEQETGSTNVENEVETSNEETQIIENTKETSSKVEEVKQYFSESRLNRETMYSQMIESYQKILESETVSETQKSIAQTEIQNINNTKNKIMICESLIKTKGIEDLIIFVNDKSISVVVRADKLEQEQIAQIQNVITREMNAEITDIHISNK